MYSYNAHQYPEAKDAGKKRVENRQPVFVSDRTSDGEIFYGVAPTVLEANYVKASEYVKKPRAETTEDDLRLYLVHRISQLNKQRKHHRR